ncbi:hypothetical protein MKK69_12870, partial [Methylobacterium sp. J-026]|uniref:hypothetical protein n=1 Tax=Methylobacterium sp. J-026 TaxID=2836624 RepID=UPI001FB981AC
MSAVSLQSLYDSRLLPAPFLVERRLVLQAVDADEDALSAHSLESVDKLGEASSRSPIVGAPHYGVLPAPAE